VTKIIKYVAIVVAGLIFLLGLNRMLRNAESPKTEPTPTNTQKNNAPTTEASTNLTYNCEPGKTAFDLLEEISTTRPETKDFSFGKQILSINGIEQGNDKYWLYLVDEKEATVSADNYTCQADELIKWELK
jgi:hypothetical protein